MLMMIVTMMMIYNNNSDDDNDGSNDGDNLNITKPQSPACTAQKTELFSYNSWQIMMPLIKI